MAFSDERRSMLLVVAVMLVTISYQTAQKLFQIHAQMITTEALECIKVALASSEIEHKAETKKKVVPRKAAGQAWEDLTLADWPKSTNCFSLVLFTMCWVHEANFIQSIVQKIYSKLKEKCSNDIEDDLVGISSRVEEMISYLDLESTDVHFIGICEKSDMGKTTLARAVFDKIINQFEACSFLENIRAES
ncbi:disease resistance protein RML1B-like [Quercus lobata]|uniref:disease resistance protein RML1B-like n=1 Tax=Quercus lobata TaxID=97700 RepID=UPI001245E17B|nr:disease resistance protein RML1B-like [Quercus lobata]